MSVAFVVTDNQVSFDVGGVGPQGAPGAFVTGVVDATSSQQLTASQSGTLFTNEGATGEVDMNLPLSPSVFAPLVFSFLVKSAESFKIVAPTGVTIQSGGDSSSAGGTFYAASVGNFLTIILVSPTLWIVANITGIWDYT